MGKKKGGGKPSDGMPITKGKHIRKVGRKKRSGAPSKGMIATAKKIVKSQ